MKKEEFKELLKKCFGKQKDERYNAIAMLILFGIFMFILIIFLRLAPTNDVNNPNNSLNPTPSSNPNQNITGNDNEEINPKEVFDINFSYIYTINNNGTKEVITGKKLDDKEIFTIINNNGSENYAKLSNNYLKKENGEYKIVESPSVNLLYADVEKAIDLTEKGELTKENNIYTYTIPTIEIIKKYHPETTLVIENTITDNFIVTVENGTMKKLELQLNNYYTTINSTQGTLNIIMEFSNVGTTENFNVTISD